MKALLARLKNFDAVIIEMARGGGVSFIVVVIGMLLGFAANIIFARHLTVAEFGSVMIVVAWAMIISIPATLGLDYAVLRFAPVYRDTNRHGALIELALFAAKSLGLSALAVSSSLAVLALVFPHALGFEHAWDFLWLFLIVLATIYINTYSSFFRAFRQIFLSQVYGQVVRPALQIILLLILFYLGFSLDTAYALFCIAAAGILTMILLLAHCAVKFREYRSADADVAVLEKRDWRKFSNVALFIGLLQEILVQSSTILSGLLASKQAAAEFSVAVRLAVLTTFGLSALASIASPMLVAYLSKRDAGYLANVARSNARLGVMCAVAVASVIFVFDKQLLALFGSGFSEARFALWVLLVANLFVAFTGVSSNILQLLGWQMLVLRVLAIAVLAQIAASLIIIPRYGSMGAALTLAVGLLVKNGLLAWQVRRRLGIDSTAMGLRPVQPRS